GLGDAAHPDLPVGEDGRIHHEGRAHALPGRPLGHVALTGGVVPEPGHHGVGHVVRDHHGRGAAVLDHREHAARPGGPRGGVLDGHAAAAAGLAVLNHHTAPTLGALARLLTPLLE